CQRERKVRRWIVVARPSGVEEQFTASAHLRSHLFGGHAKFAPNCSWSDRLVFGTFRRPETSQRSINDVHVRDPSIENPPWPASKPISRRARCWALAAARRRISISAFRCRRAFWPLGSVAWRA